MAILERTYAPEAGPAVDEVLVSADSHVIEPAGLWKDNLPRAFRDRAPDLGGSRRNDAPGGMDKSERVKEMAHDGVSAEVLYPTHGLKTLVLGDRDLEEACVRVYNDWLMDYCSAAPESLIGLALLSTYRIDAAIEEMERCRRGGMSGAVVWQVPAPELPFTSRHYDALWASAQELDMPIALHILSGHGYNLRRTFSEGGAPTFDRGIEQERTSVNLKLVYAMDSLYDFIFSGVLERFPRLKLVLVENEIGWLPFILEQWDYYYKRHGTDREALSLTMLPSEYFNRQVYATFFNDAVGGRILSWWGADNCMWSNDYPHGNSTWPKSREIVSRDMGALPPDVRAKLLHENVEKLYGIKTAIPAKVPV